MTDVSEWEVSDLTGIGRFKIGDRVQWGHGAGKIFTIQKFLRSKIGNRAWYAYAISADEEKVNWGVEYITHAGVIDALADVSGPQPHEAR